MSAYRASMILGLALWASCVVDPAAPELAASDCMALMAEGHESGVFSLGESATADELEPTVFCENQLAGGGWRLVSVQHENDRGVLFGDDRCVSVAEECAGSLAPEELSATGEGVLLIATTDGDHWLSVESNSVLDEFLTRARELRAENFCHAPHFCQLLAQPLAIVAHSANFQPLAQTVASLWVTSGGLALRGPDGGVIAAFNLAPYGGLGGALFIAGAEDRGTDDFSVVAGAPGALYYRAAR